MSDKLGVVSALLDRVDTILIGGGMCFTFLAAAGYPTGESLVESEQLDRCRGLLHSNRIVLPSDLVLGSDDSPDRWVRSDLDVPPGWKGRDIGPGTVATFTKIIKTRARCYGTVPWAYSRIPALPTELVPSPSPSLRRPPFRSSEEATPWPPSLSSGYLAGSISISTGGGATLEFIEQAAIFLA